MRGSTMQTIQRAKCTKKNKREKSAVSFLKQVFSQAGGLDGSVRARLLEFGNSYKVANLN